MILYAATTNPGKLREFQLAAGQGFEILPIERFDPVDETGSTFEENARLKAAAYSMLAPGLVLAEDSGLEVDALDGEPGVRSARFSSSGSDEENNRLLIERLQGVENRTARYVCVLALAERGSVIDVFRGEVQGVIIDEPRGSGGFGYDPHFFYPPYGCTFAQATAEDKFKVSHRGRAMGELSNFLLTRMKW